MLTIYIGKRSSNLKSLKVDIEETFQSMCGGVESCNGLVGLLV